MEIGFVLYQIHQPCRSMITGKHNQGVSDQVTPFVGKGGSQAKQLDKQESVTREARERMSAISSHTHAMQMDLQGVAHASKLQQTSTHLVSVSVVTVGRNLARAQATAAKAEKVLELAPGSVFILLNYDFVNPSHYEQGFKALYDGMVNNAVEWDSIMMNSGYYTKVPI